MSTQKTLNLVFNSKAETVPEFLGVPLDRAHEIQDDITSHLSNDSRNEDIERIYNTYDGAELVWALFSLAPAEQVKAMQGAEESIGEGDEDL